MTQKVKTKVKALEVCLLTWFASVRSLIIGVGTLEQVTKDEMHTDQTSKTKPTNIDRMLLVYMGWFLVVRVAAQARHLALASMTDVW